MKCPHCGKYLEADQPTEEDELRALALWLGGLSYREVGEKMGVPQSRAYRAVTQRLDKMSPEEVYKFEVERGAIQERQRREEAASSRAIAQANWLFELWMSGMTYRGAGREVGLSAERTRQLIMRYCRQQGGGWSGWFYKMQARRAWALRRARRRRP